MNRLILSAAIPALLLAACAGGPAQMEVPALTVADVPRPLQTPPPHMPTDLSPAGVRAADDHLALEAVNGAEAMAFVAGENERSLATLTGDRRYETFRQQAFDILSATDRTPRPDSAGKRGRSPADCRRRASDSLTRSRNAAWPRRRRWVCWA